MLADAVMSVATFPLCPSSTVIFPMHLQDSPDGLPFLLCSILETYKGYRGVHFREEAARL
jgi:hypothetical protein